MIGLEPTLEAHLENLVGVFREVRRVLRGDGTVWLNYGDAYASQGGHTGRNDNGQSTWSGGPVRSGPKVSKPSLGLKPKDLLLLPARVALALQSDGWWVRSEIVWHKPNPMPESVRDRPTSSHEKVWLLSKGPRYFWDAEAVRVPVTGGAGARCPKVPFGDPPKGKDAKGNGYKWADGNLDPSRGANLRNVWTLPTEPYPGAHFATMPTGLVEPCIRAGTSERGVCGECGAPWVRATHSPGIPAELRNREGVKMQYHERGVGINGPDMKKFREDNPTTTLGWYPPCECNDESRAGFVKDTVPAIVLDPFAGAGTVPLVAQRLGRRSIGIELNREYARMAQRRLESDLPVTRRPNREDPEAFALEMSP